MGLMIRVTARIIKLTNGYHSPTIRAIIRTKMPTNHPTNSPVNVLPVIGSVKAPMLLALIMIRMKIKLSRIKVKTKNISAAR